MLQVWTARWHLEQGSFVATVLLLWLAAANALQGVGVVVWRLLAAVARVPSLSPNASLRCVGSYLVDVCVLLVDSHLVCT